ncbi:DUF1616 domain-containing protein [Chloroflexota bacterium]
MDWLRELFGFAFPILERVPIIRVIIVSALVFFLPGFAWTLIFFQEINAVERIALSFGLSIVLVTLSILALNMLLGVRITGFNSLAIICLITALPLAIYYIKRRMSGRSEHNQ